MYFPIGWPKSINLSIPSETFPINHICCDAVKILVAAVGNDFLGIWYANPLIPITFHRRTFGSVSSYGSNKVVIWKPDSRMLAIITDVGALLLYQIDFDINSSGVLTQVDPPLANLKRDSAELFIKENIPRLRLKERNPINLGSRVTSFCCISLTEIVIATANCEFIKTQWDVLENGGSQTVINLRNIPFYMNQNSNLKSLPPIGADSFVSTIEYSPFIGGFAAVFNDYRAAFLIAVNLRFEEQNMHGFWVPDLEDATVCSVNHKFRLLAYGRKNSEVSVYSIEDATGGLEFSHKLSLNSKVFPGSLGAVNEIKWSPDGCVIIVSWDNGGLSLWSTFGTMLMSSLSWDFGLHIDLLRNNPLQISKMEWSTEGYQMFLTRKETKDGEHIFDTNVLLLNFVKSTLTMNPCMASNSHVLLQGDDTLYLNQGDSLEKIYFGSQLIFPNNQVEAVSKTFVPQEESLEIEKNVDISTILSESKYWSVLQLPLTYASTNWPIRYSAIDVKGLHIAVAGRTGLAHYSMLTKKWKLFGNESQEKDFVVSGGLLWWKGFVVMGCYSILDRTDEIRCYPEECKLDNQFGNKIQVRAPVISLNMFRDQLIALTADGIVSMFVLTKHDANNISVVCIYEIDIRSICIHPACIVSLTVTNLKNEMAMKNCNVVADASSETIIFNVCGRILMIQRDSRTSVINSLMATCLASCVECFWLSNGSDKSPMRDCLWLYSGAHGMRVWLPILPPNEEVHDTHRLHTFMTKRIMLSFPLKLYPLVILFDNVIVLGVENETTLYTSEVNSHFSLPFSLLERKSQVYLHKILRQLIKRNLGYSAWEIAKSCRALPYFPHSLELLLHEVLEEEATSKDPIPDALLPSVLDFIREFPVYMQTIVQCARKTEIALWPYLFSVAGKPKDLFQQCLENEELETAASYLIILQNLEPSAVSKQYATLLLDIALENRKWDLAKDLMRFLKAIDPNEIDSPRSSMIVNNKIAPPTQSQAQVNSNPEVFNLILGPIARERSFSTTIAANIQKSTLGTGKDKKEKQQLQVANGSTSLASSVVHGGSSVSNEPPSAAASNGFPLIRRKAERSNSTKEKKETFFLETILQRHARKLLQKCKLIELGYMSAFLDFHLVSWLTQEKDSAAKLDDFVATINLIHEELKLPPPFVNYGNELQINAIDFAHIQRSLLLDSRRNHVCHASSNTSESGYFSLALAETSNGNLSTANPIPSIIEDQELNNTSYSQVNRNQPCKSRSNSQQSYDNSYCHYSSMYDDVQLSADLGSNNLQIGEDYRGRLLSEKLSVKIRYLLQLFVEANCTDYALILSILLLDAASISRIINVVIRSESISSCIRIETALKRITQWSFEKDCVYRMFMISLQPHIYLLDQYIQSTTSSMKLNAVRKSDETAESSSLDTTADSLLDMQQSSNIGNSNIVNWTDPKKYIDLHVDRETRTDSYQYSTNNMRSHSKNNKTNFNDHIIRNENGMCLVM